MQNREEGEGEEEEKEDKENGEKIRRKRRGSKIEGRMRDGGGIGGEEEQRHQEKGS